MFDDPTVEIQDLTLLIKQDIAGLNSGAASLQLMWERASSSQADGNSGSPRHSSGNGKDQEESGARGARKTSGGSSSCTVLDSLRSRLASAEKEFASLLALRAEVSSLVFEVWLGVQPRTR